MKLIALLTIPVLAFWACVLLLLCGCRALDQKIVQESSTQTPAEINPLKLNSTLGGGAPREIFYSGTGQSQAVIAPTPTLYRMAWHPGAYSNFVVVASEDISAPVEQWPVYEVTTGTNFVFDARLAPQKFFTLYGTNEATGEAAWLVKTWLDTQPSPLSLNSPWPSK